MYISICDSAHPASLHCQGKHLLSSHNLLFFFLRLQSKFVNSLLLYIFLCLLLNFLEIFLNTLLQPCNPLNVPSYSASLPLPTFSKKWNYLYFLMPMHSLQWGFKHSIPNIPMPPKKVTGDLHCQIQCTLPQSCSNSGRLCCMWQHFSLKLLFLDCSMSAFSFHPPDYYLFSFICWLSSPLPPMASVCCHFLGLCRSSRQCQWCSRFSLRF